jgi:hypothetical protein
VGEAAAPVIIGAGVMMLGLCNATLYTCPITFKQGCKSLKMMEKAQCLMEVDVAVRLSSLFDLIAAGWLGGSEVEVQGKNIHARVASAASCILAEHWPVTCSRHGPSVNVITSYIPRHHTFETLHKRPQHQSLDPCQVFVVDEGYRDDRITKFDGSDAYSPLHLRFLCDRCSITFAITAA